WYVLDDLGRRRRRRRCWGHSCTSNALTAGRSPSRGPPKPGPCLQGTVVLPTALTRTERENSREATQAAPPPPASSLPLVRRTSPQFPSDACGLLL
ncbi:hypothetical protein B296_00034252, partial [Ensete ventricosum]